MNNNLELAKAYQMEAELLDIQELMDDISTEENEVNREQEEFRIRNMMLAINYLEKEVDEMKKLRDLVKSNWDSQIKKKEENIDEIKEYIEGWLLEDNNEKALRTDVGTASLRNSSIRLSLKKENEENLVTALEQNGYLENYLKPAVFDKQKYIRETQNAIKDKAKKFTEEQVAKLEMAGEKITKKRENEMLKENELAFFKEFENQEGFYFEVNYPKKSVSIRKSVDF